MSGGHFDYRQYVIDDIANDIDQLIKNNNKKDEYGYSYNFSERTIQEFKNALNLLRNAAVYAQRIDWLVSGDDGEKTFHKRLKDELEQQKKNKKKNQLPIQLPGQLQLPL